MATHLIDDDKEEHSIAVREVHHDSMPEELRGLSEEELKAIEKKLVRKADLVIL
jgi:hypothetical protein